MNLPHKSNVKRKSFNLKGYKAIIITTSQASLDQTDDQTGKVIKVGKATGVYASEMTEPYYTFLDAGMDVEIASIAGGKIPIEKLSLRPLVRTIDDSRFLKDPVLKEKVERSKSISEINSEDYDIIFLAGGWGAAYDFAQSSELSTIMTHAYASQTIIGAVCHGPLGLIGATKPDGSPLVEDVKLTAVTNKQLKQLMVGNTPKHPETELRKAGAKYESTNGLIHMFKSRVVVDNKHLIVTGQNQKAGIETAQSALELLEEKVRAGKDAQEK